MDITRKPFGEVVTSTLARCSIQSWNWDEHPAYGSLVTLEEGDHQHAAVIYTIETTSCDAARIPTAYKKTHAELRAEYPHIFSLLRTNLECIILGTHTPHHLEPCLKPPRIHTFAVSSSEEQIAVLFQTPEYVATIMQALEPSVADMLMHTLMVNHKKSLSLEQLQDMVKEYIRLTGNDYKRIYAFNRFLLK